MLLLNITFVFYSIIFSKFFVFWVSVSETDHPICLRIRGFPGLHIFGVGTKNVLANLEELVILNIVKIEIFLLSF